MARFNVGDKVVIARSYSEFDLYVGCIGRVGTVFSVTPRGRYLVDGATDHLWFESELSPFGAGAEYFNAIMGSYNIKDSLRIGDEVVIVRSISDAPRCKSLIGTTATIIDRTPADAVILSNSPRLYWAPSELMPVTNQWSLEFDHAEELL